MEIQWVEILALAINAPLVTLAVQLIKKYGPRIPSTLKAILAVAGGPLVLMGQGALANFLNKPIDLTPLAEVLGGLMTGAAAAAIFATAKHEGERKR